MDEQKWTQLINEQSLVNLSIIEQLNQQAGYLQSIIERLERLTNLLMEQKNQQGENQLPIRPLGQEQPSANLKSSADIPIVPNRHAMLLDEAAIRRLRKEQEMDMAKEEKAKRQQENGPATPMPNTVQTEGTDEGKLIPEWEDIFAFGDRIRVITDNVDQTGVFMEIDGEYLVWVIDDAQLTFTNLKGATIIRLS